MEGNVRPINANTFSEHLKDWKYDIENDYYIEPSKRSIISDTLETAIEDLSNCPTIDYVPAVYGNWVKTENGDTCSVCRCSLIAYFANAAIPIQLSSCKYCPHCGAKMESESDDSA